MQLTTNYQLKKPELTDPANITELNSNYDTIDTELKGRRLSTVSVSNANLNTLLADKTYSCSGTITNAPISNTFCIVECFDNGDGVIVQLCHVPQNDHTVRSFVRSVSNGAVFGSWSELSGVATAKAYLEALISENTLRFNALSGALVNQLTNLNVEVFDSTSSINTSLGDGSVLVGMYDAEKHVFNKSTNTSLTVYLNAKTVTTGNNNAWCLVDFDNVLNGAVSMAISRNDGASYTNLTNGSITSISSQSKGVSMIIRLTLNGQLKLKNLAWGVK